ncbi:carboxypeptidase-like regulatory domain-containing protein [Tenacibaculum sp. TC6]|uniref:carboxypeptidase-like regulatory domain-containing protein n=1 Tax=Tenacibaculum sp. TC6 TaxID=3423223 RepID=UPI003D36C623
MKNNFTLSIKDPCSENYQNFAPTKKGGFCGSCKKEVIDFTKMSSEEINVFFTSNRTTKTCGRFNSHQLKTYTNHSLKRKSFHFLGGLGVAFISLCLPNTLQAQKAKPITEASVTNLNFQKEAKLKGKVSDESGPLPGVSILLEGSTIGTETDFDGNFEFPEQVKEGDVLIFSFIGMKTEKITIAKNQKYVLLSMKSDFILGEIVITGEVTMKKTFTSKRKKSTL